VPFFLRISKYLIFFNIYFNIGIGSDRIIQNLAKNSHNVLILLLILVVLSTCNISFAEENPIDNGDKKVNNESVVNVNSSTNNSIIDKNNSTLNEAISQDKIVSTAKKLNTYIKKNNKLPKTVTCDGYNLTIPEFTYLMAKTVQYKNNNNYSPIILKIGIKYPGLPTGDSINKRIHLKDYYLHALKTIKYVDKYNKLPNYLSDNDKKIQFQTYVFMFSEAVSSENLARYVHLNVKKNSKLNKYSNPYIEGNGLWLWSQYMNSVNFKKLKNAGIGNIFLLEKAIYDYGMGKVINFAKRANKYNIKVHIWFCTFKVNGKWTNPINAKTKSYNYAYFNKILKRVDRYSKIKAFAGIHFDYVRYSGVSLKAYKYNYKNSVSGEKAILKFVEMASKIARKNNKDIVLSAALMPEPKRSVRLYGQNTTELAKHLDILIPMVYKYAFGKNNNWIKKTTQWYINNSGNAKVWVGLEVYDKKIKPLSPQKMISSSKAALKGGADGLVLFRFKLWKITNLLKAY